jgi:hypothetical protein
VYEKVKLIFLEVETNTGISKSSFQIIETNINFSKLRKFNKDDLKLPTVLKILQGCCKKALLRTDPTFLLTKKNSTKNGERVDVSEGLF